MNKGYLILPRSFFCSYAWKEKRVYSDAEAWLDIIGSAHYDNEPYTAIIHKKSVTWERGEWPVSLRFLANRWQWSIGQVRAFLKRLCDYRLVGLKTNNAITIIQIVDYDKYCGFTNNTLHNTPNSTAHNTPASIAIDYDNPLTDSAFKHQETTTKTQATTHGQHTTNTVDNTKKNKDINISINNINYAREKEKNIHDEIQEMSANESWREAICMRHHITPQQLTQYLELFATDCVCCGRPLHHNMTDALSHFHHWLRIQLLQHNTSSTQNTRNKYDTTSKPTSTELIREAQQWAIQQSEDLIHKATLRHSGIQEPLPY